jgi:hypothetical protein
MLDCEAHEQREQAYTRLETTKSYRKTDRQRTFDNAAAIQNTSLKDRSRPSTNYNADSHKEEISSPKKDKIHADGGTQRREKLARPTKEENHHDEATGGQLANAYRLWLPSAS